jgi:hypothetical protein
MDQPSLLTRIFIDQLVDLCEEATWLWNGGQPPADQREQRIEQINRMRQRLHDIRLEVERE